MPALTDLISEGIQELRTRSGHAGPFPDECTPVRTVGDTQPAHAAVIRDGHDTFVLEHAWPR
eukprot:3706966-Alexandrium_andersonii.AAC.1